MDFRLIVKFFYLSYLEINNIYTLVIKYREFVRIFKNKNNLLQLTDVDAWKCRERKGLETLLAYTLNYEY